MRKLELQEYILDPRNFSEAFLKILDKEQKLVPFIWNDLQRDFFSKRTGKDIILKSRQIGFSTLAQAIIFFKVVSSSQSAIILAHDDATTQKLRLIQDRFYDNFPDNIREFRKPIRKYANATLTTYPETNSTVTIATAGSSNTGRGGTYTLFHGSEVAFWTNPEEIIAGAMQGMSKPDIILESTPNGTGGWFYNLCMDSLSGRNDWKLHFYPWTMFDEYQIPGWEQAKRRELGRLFDQEYPSDIVSCFLTSGKGFFNDIAVDYTAPLYVEYNPSHKYTGGLDFGQSNDFTCLIVIDRTTRQMVDKLHINKMSWNMQRAEIKRMYNKWRLAGLRAEINSIGSVNIEELEKDGVTIEPFNTSNSTKQRIFQQLHEELESGLQLQDWDILRSEMNTITSKQTQTGLWSISAEGNSHDDCPMGLALAISAKLSQERKARSWSNS